MTFFLEVGLVSMLAKSPYVRSFYCPAEALVGVSCSNRVNAGTLSKPTKTVYKTDVCHFGGRPFAFLRRARRSWRQAIPRCVRVAREAAAEDSIVCRINKAPSRFEEVTTALRGRTIFTAFRSFNFRFH